MNKCSTRWVAKHSKHSRRSMYQHHREVRHCKIVWWCAFSLDDKLNTQVWKYKPWLNGCYEMSLKHTWTCSCTYNMSSACFQFQQSRDKLLFVALWKEWISWVETKRLWQWSAHDWMNKRSQLMIGQCLNDKPSELSLLPLQNESIFLSPRVSTG